MAKLTTLAATFALFFVAGMASITITIDEENPSQSQQCRQQIQSQRLNACRQYLVQSSRTIMTASNQGGWREQFQQCCQELDQIDEQCRCDGIRRAVQQQGELQGREMQEMLETAKNLPGLCRMGPRRCDIRAVGF